MFKTSSNKKNNSNVKLNINNNNNNDVESTITNEHIPVNNKQQTIELINYQRKNFDETNFKIENSCNTWKAATPCEIICRTRGMVLIVSNCGIVISWREIYVAESLTQEALLFLDTLDLLIGIVIFFNY